MHIFIHSPFLTKSSSIDLVYMSVYLAKNQSTLVSPSSTEGVAYPSENWYGKGNLWQLHMYLWTLLVGQCLLNLYLEDQVKQWIASILLVLLNFTVYNSDLYSMFSVF